MATEVNGLIHVKDSTGNLYVLYPLTKAEDVSFTDGKTLDEKFVAMTGATSSAAGSQGLVPAPASGKQASFLRGDGTWQVPTNTVYTHPTTSGNKHIPSGGSSGQILRWSSDGTAAWGADNNTTYSAMTGATTSAAGSAGLVPAPAAGAATRYLRSDGTWQVPPDTNTVATLSSLGLTATAAELNTLDGITATVTELNYTDGVTSNIQTQLNNKAAAITLITITLSSSSWTASGNVYTQSASVSGVSATETDQLITITPKLSSQAAYMESGVYASAQASGSITFTATSKPTASLTVYATIQSL